MQNVHFVLPIFGMIKTFVIPNTGIIFIWLKSHGFGLYFFNLKKNICQKTFEKTSYEVQNFRECIYISGK